SNLTQPQRNRAMEGFRRGDFQVLVATNIAARGLDVEHITHVISFDVPNVPEEYVHRIGRTGRAQAEGDAFVLVSPGEEKSLGRVDRHIGERRPRVTLREFDYEQTAPARHGNPGHRPGAGKPSAGGGKPPRRKPAPASESRRAKGNGPPPAPQRHPER